MADDDAIVNFTAITSASPERASQYLTLADGNLEQAIQLYFDSDGVDMGGTIGETNAPQPTASGPGRPTEPTEEPIKVDSDDDSGGGVLLNEGAQPSTDDDEAIARRMQEEMYGGQTQGDLGSQPGNMKTDDIDPETGVRRPMARTAETLAGPSAPWRMDDEQELEEAVREQMLRRQQMQRQRPGIFNQRPPPSSASIWEDGNQENSESHRQNLSRATGGASETSSKSNKLAEMYRPPFELISTLVSWEGVRAEGKENQKWILVNVQNSNIFDCQVLNRDIWKNPQIRDTVKENFIFKQYTKDDPQGNNYIRYYFQAYQSDDAYPHIAIVDPRTGEQVKVWSGVPAPKPMEFLAQLHEFLDRYSLNALSKNPVATRKQEKKPMGVGKMTEDEMLEMAMHNSLEAGGRTGPKDHDPDNLTKTEGVSSSMNGVTTQDSIAQQPDDTKVETTPSPFSLISSSNPHEEPPADQPNTTRIQFRHPGGRVIRRFALDEDVRRIYEWLKASPLEGQGGKPFELSYMGKNMVDSLDMTIDSAGLKNGSVMVEYMEE